MKIFSEIVNDTLTRLYDGIGDRQYLEKTSETEPIRLPADHFFGYWVDHLLHKPFWRYLERWTSPSGVP